VGGFNSLTPEIHCLWTKDIAMILRVVVAIAILFAGQEPALAGRSPERLHYYPNDGDVGCLIGRAETMATAGEMTPDELAHQIIDACHRSRPHWFRCTSMDFYCHKFDRDALIPFVKGIIAEQSVRKRR
jgi:hypothetical protein